MTPMLLHLRCFITAAYTEEPKLDKLLVCSITAHIVLAEALVNRSKRGARCYAAQSYYTTKLILLNQYNPAGACAIAHTSC